MPSSPSKSSAASADTTQVKGVRKIVKNIRRSLHRVSHTHLRQEAAASAVHDQDGRLSVDVPSLSVEVKRQVPSTSTTSAISPASPRSPISPRSKASSDTFARSAAGSPKATGIESDSEGSGSFHPETDWSPSSNGTASSLRSIGGHAASPLRAFTKEKVVHTPSQKSLDLTDSEEATVESGPHPSAFPGQKPTEQEPPVVNVPSLLFTPPAPVDIPPSTLQFSLVESALQPLSFSVLDMIPERPASTLVPETAQSPSQEDAMAVPQSEETTSTLDSQFGAAMQVEGEEQLSGPPPVAIEPEVPDAFLSDEPEEVVTEEATALEEHPTGLSVEDTTESLAADEITLAGQPSPSSLKADLPADVNKAVPPPPTVESDEDEEETPELYLPGLTIPTMFLPIPNTDPLTTLLNKYISPEKRRARDVTGDWSRSDFHTLVMTGSWRALARMARDRIVDADPEDLNVIFSLWYVRLSSLARMRLFNQTSAECTNLFMVLNAVEPAASRQWLFDRIIPFELEVLHAKLKYWAGDHMGYLDALTALLRRCKTKARRAKSDTAGTAMWQERGARVCLIIASQLVEMKDFSAAAKLLEPLCKQGGGGSSPALRSAVGRIYLQGGYTSMAAMHFSAVAGDPAVDPVLKAMNTALLASADGDWQRATDELRRILAADPENYVAINNLSVTLLSQGNIQEAIDVLENALQSSPAAIVTAEPLLFNLSTLYELRSATGADKKRDLLIEVAKWAGDGLRTTCLKMPSN